MTISPIQQADSFSLKLQESVNKLRGLQSLSDVNKISHKYFGAESWDLRPFQHPGIRNCDKLSTSILQYRTFYW